MLDHELDRERGVLVIEPIHPLEPGDFAAVAATVDPWVEQKGRLGGLVLHAPTFPAWAGLAALIHRLRFRDDHHQQIERIAVVTDDDVMAQLSAFADHFVAGQVKRFADDQLDEAMEWVAGAAS